MIRIALTGPSGAGKGYVGAILTAKGHPVLDTDALVHEMYEKGDLPQQIGAMFGKEVLTSSGSVARKKLAEIVFSDPKCLENLNALVHREVRSAVSLWLMSKENEGCSVAFVDAPQLFEAKMERDFDCIWAVIAPSDIRLSRICERDGISVEAARQRMKNQKSSETYSALAHETLMNDGNNDLEKQVENLLKIILKL